MVEAMDREETLDRLKRDRFDVLVVGGGITGCGIALDAAARGLKTALVERGDLASGTSGKSSKLIHGGLRYLRRFQFGVTFEASREKAVLKRLAPHLVEDLPFLFPLWSRLQRPRVGAALWIYDAAAGFPNGLVHRHVDAAAALDLVPGLRTEGLRGGYVYHDARADDCRLVVHVARKAADLGAVVVPGVEVVDVVPDGVRVRDFRIAAGRVVLAAGVWGDALRGGASPMLRPSKGVHLVVGAERLKLKAAAVLPSPEDGRVVFLIPRDGRVLIGTTDTDYGGPLDAPRAERADVDYLLARVNACVPGAALARTDVESTYAGLRPLLQDASAAPSAASREHRIEEGPHGSIVVAGGKLTTYRLMAEQVVDRLTQAPCPTASIDLFATEARDPVARRWGSEAGRIGDRTPLGPYVLGEVDHAVERGFARTLSDVLIRRLRTPVELGDQGRSIAETAAARMFSDAAERTRQIDAFLAELDDVWPRRP
jgi:glycerol-3-phosphate dehydrogenase